MYNNIIIFFIFFIFKYIIMLLSLLLFSFLFSLSPPSYLFEDTFFDPCIDILSDFSGVFLEAVSEGDSEKVFDLLKNEAIDLNQPMDEKGNTLIHLVIQAGMLDVFHYLLDQNIDIRVRNRLGRTPFHRAVSVDDWEAVLFLFLKDSAVVNEVGDQGLTPLHIAVLENESMVPLLLSLGACVNQVCFLGNSALHYACQKELFSTVKLLLYSGIDLYLCNEEGYDALCYAIFLGHLGIVRALFSVIQNCSILIEVQLMEKYLNMACGLRNMDVFKILLQLDSEDILLHEVCFLRHVQSVCSLLQLGVDVNEVDYLGKTALHYACQRGYSDIVNQLLLFNCDLTIKDHMGRTALYYACQRGHLDIVDRLLRCEGYFYLLHQEDEKGISAFDEACQNQQTRVIKCILRFYSAHPSLWVACQYGFYEVAQLLMNQGLDINTCLSSGETALHHACLKGVTETVSFLVERGANVYCRLYLSGQIPLHYAVSGGFIDIVRLLLQKRRRQLYEKDLEGWLAVHYASEWGHLDILKEILIVEPDVSLVNYRGATPLHLASRRGHFHVVQFLLNYDLSLMYEVDNFGRIPLFEAILGQHVDVVKLFLEEGSLVYHQDQKGLTVLDYVIQTRQDLVLSLVLNFIPLLKDPSQFDQNCLLSQFWIVSHSNYSDFNLYLSSTRMFIDLFKIHNVPLAVDEMGRTLLHFSSQYGYFEISELLLLSGVNVNSIDVWGRSPLYYACLEGHLMIVLLLIEWGARLDIRDIVGDTLLHAVCFKKNFNETLLLRQLFLIPFLFNRMEDVNFVNSLGQMPLHYVSRLGCIDMLESLLNLGQFSVNEMDSKSKTPFHYACQSGCFKVVELLLNSGAYLEQADNLGRTPLHYACQTGVFSIVELLLKAGVSCSCVDLTFKTPLHYAVSLGYFKVVELLLDFLPGFFNYWQSMLFFHTICQHDRLPYFLPLDLPFCDQETKSLLPSQVHYERTVEVLSEYGFSLNLVDECHMTALHHASINGYFCIAETLLRCGAYTHLKDRVGMTAFDYACQKKNLRMQNLLLDGGSKRRPFCLVMSPRPSFNKDKDSTTVCVSSHSSLFQTPSSSLTSSLNLEKNFSVCC